MEKKLYLIYLVWLLGPEVENNNLAPPQGSPQHLERLQRTKMLIFNYSSKKLQCRNLRHLQRWKSWQNDLGAQGSEHERELIWRIERLVHTH